MWLLGSFVDVMFLWNVALQKYERVSDRASEAAFTINHGDGVNWFLLSLSPLGEISWKESM